MGNDYWDGRQDPYSPVDYTRPGASDYARGQYDEAKQRDDQARGIQPGGGSYPRNPRKDVTTGLILSVIFGPLGLFYASKIGAIVMLAVWVVLAVLMAGPDSGGILGTAWLIAASASVILSVIAVKAYNRKFS